MWVLKSLKNTLYFICVIYKLQFAIEYIQIGYILNVLCFFQKDLARSSYLTYLWIKDTR